MNDPTEQILHYTKVPDWDLIIVGDSKTDGNKYQNIKCIYLGLDEQKKMFPSFYEKIPLKSYAIKNKYETDDDNKYLYDLNTYNNILNYDEENILVMI